MKFAEKLRAARTNAGMTQEELARKLQITCRTLQNYESGAVHPKKREVYGKLAEIFRTAPQYWLSEDDNIQLQTGKSFPTQDHYSLKAQVSALFLDDTLEDSELDDMMRQIQNAYWEAKERRKSILK